MKQFRKKLSGLGILCLVAVLAFMMTMCAKPEPTEPTAGTLGDPIAYTVRIENQSGMGLSGIGVYVYEDSTHADLVWFAKTDDAGQITFTAPESSSYVAVLSEVTTGYAVEAEYPLTGAVTEIVLSAAQLSEDEMDKVVYKLGDMMMDFTVEDAEQNTYTLYELLKGKKAVVLNFWYANCDPCKGEFPYLQEAYDAYKDQIELIAMDPVDDAETVEAFRKEQGYTFPMLACDPVWQKMMDITAYPTTVVVDRYGNIMLIHKGAVDSAKTLTDAFAYFTAEDYTQKPIENISDLAIEEPQGTQSNPLQVGGVTEFEVTVEAGKDFHVDLFKVKDMYMQIRSKDASVTYNGKTYKPQNGTVGLVVNAPDTYTPAKLVIANNGTAKQTFKVQLTPLQGTLNNPFPLKLGDFTAQIAAGNEQGVYYTYKATEDGIFTLKCLSATAGVKYGYTLYNLNSYAQRTLEGEGTTDEAGYPTLSIQAKKGQTVQVILSTLPDESNMYPAASLNLRASFEAGEIEDEEKVEKIAYTVTVKDDAGEPIPNVSITLIPEAQEPAEGEEAEGEQTEIQPILLSTNAEGIASVQLPKGTYQGSFLLPEGYEEVEDATFVLTEEKPSAEIELKKIVIVIHDYAVTVVDTNGSPVADAKVKIGDTVMTTDTQGKAVFTLEEGSYTVLIQSLPEIYTAAQDAYTFEEGKITLEIVLSIKPGTAGNPYLVENYPFDTVAIAPGAQTHFLLKNAGGMELIIRNDAATVTYGGQTYSPVSGVVTVPLEQGDAAIVLRNTADGDRGFTLRVQHPLGAKENPIALTQLGEIPVSLKAGREEGCFYTWTASEFGTVHFSIAQAPAGISADLVLTVGNVSVKLSEVGLSEIWQPVQAGDKVTLQVTAAGAAAGLTVLGQFRLPPNSANHPQVITDITSIPVELAETDPDGWFLRWTATNSGVAAFRFEGNAAGEIILTVEGSETVAKLSDGMTDGSGNPIAALTVARGDVVNIQVIASGNRTVLGTLTQDSNSAENPDVLADITTIETNLVAGDPNGHFYVWTADKNGTVTMTLASVTEGVNGTVALQVNGGTWQLMSDGTVKAKVKAGDELLICVSVQEQAGSYPAAQLTVSGSFAHEQGTAQNPHVVADISAMEAQMDAGNAEGYFFRWTATGAGNAVFHIAQAQVGGAAVSEPAEKLDVTLLVNGVRKSALSENESKDADGNRIVSVAVQAGDVLDICVTTLENSHPAAQVTVSGKVEMKFSIKVTDMQNKAYPGVAVSVLNGTKKVYSGTTDISGAVSFQAAGANYTVELGFEGTAYYYDKAAAVLSPDRPSLTVRLANYMDTSAVYDSLWALNGANTYVLQPGSTYVEIGTGKPYFCADQDNNCLFIFHPEVGGTYKFTVDNPNVEITYRNSPFYAFQIATSAGTEDNSFTYSVGNSTAGNIDMIIGVKAVEGVAGVVINITRIGDPNLTVEDLPWSEEWKKGNGHTGCSKVSGGLTYLNINAASGTYDLYYDAAKDVYRLYEGGPILYVDLNSARHGISLFKIIHGDGTAGGAPIRRYFYDENGAFTKKEDYTATLEEYFNCAGQTSIQVNCYHPLTADLAYILQNGGAQWWDSTSPSHIETLVTANPDYAWLFLCGYKG